jgi:nitrate/nitrite transport system permease protein
MTEAVDHAATPAGVRVRGEHALHWLSRHGGWFNALGLAALLPLLRLLAGDNPGEQWRELRRLLLLPLSGIGLFLLLWAVLAPQVQTSLGALPGPAAVWEQAGALWQDHRAERAKRAAFHARQAERNAQLRAADPDAEIRQRRYTGKPTYIDQIGTSLITVCLGFVLSTLIAVPLGIAAGLSRSVSGALNPLIQLFRPVSPLAWLPLVTMLVSALYLQPVDGLPKSLLISAITVTLCSLWPTLINTMLGVSTIDRDLVNVGRVLQLSTFTTLRRLVLPSALPLIFTGLRLSLGVGWMVLIAAEMLAQNPGLGKFVWDEFQNGSSQSLARLMVAVLTVGAVGLLLDRLMAALQQTFTYQPQR